MRKNYIFVVLIVLLSVAAITTQITLQRPATHDQQASDDLQLIQNQLDSYYRGHKALPASLSQLSFDPKVSSRLGRYTYHNAPPDTSSQDYQLCATFETSNYVSGPNTPDTYSMYANFNSHAKGNHCFNLTASDY